MPKGILNLLAVFGIIGGALQILFQIGFDLWGKTSTDVIEKKMAWTSEETAIAVSTGVISLVGNMLILLSLFAIFAYAYNTKPSKNTIVSFILMFIGTTLNVCLNWYFAFVEPMLLIYAPDVVLPVRSPFIEGEIVSFLLMALTGLYFGISSIVSRALPLTGAILLTAVPLAGFSPGGQYFVQAVWGLAIIWVSLAVYRSNSQIAQKTA